MSDESTHDELHDRLREVFGAEVAALDIAASPTTAVMSGGAALRTRRRLTAVSGVAALAVLPVAAVAAFAGGGSGGNGTGSGRHNEALSPASSATSSAPSYPPPIVVPTPLPKPGQLNQALPNDSIVVLDSGTVDGKQWRLVRDRYVVAGPEPANVMGDPSSRPHLPYADNWGKSGTIECDFTGIQWGDAAPGDRSEFGAGGGCGPTDEGSITRLVGRFGMAGSELGDTRAPVTHVEGRIDGTNAAYVTADVDGKTTAKAPVIEVPGEKNDYYVIPLPAGFRHVSITVYDAQGHSLGSQEMLDMEMDHGPAAPSTTAKK